MSNLLSYFLYIIVFFLSFLFMFLYEKSKNKNFDFIYLFIVFFILFLVLALRYDVGADYSNYTNVISDGLKNNNYYIFEIGWVPLFYLMDNLNFPPHFFFVFTSFISIFLIIISIKKQNASVCICLYLALGYIESFTVVRQCFAASIYTFFFSLYLKKGEIKKLILGSIISSLFHTSMFLTFFLIPIVYYIKRKEINWSYSKNILLFVLFYIIFSFIDFTEILIFFLSYTPYAVYARMGENLIGTTELGTGLGLMLRYLILLSLLFYKPSKNALQSKQYDSKMLTRFLFIFVLYIFFLLSTQIKIFMRLPLVFNTLLSVLYVYNKNKYSKLKKYAVYIFTFLLYFGTLLKSTRNISGSWDLIPYYIIF